MTFTRLPLLALAALFTLGSCVPDEKSEKAPEKKGPDPIAEIDAFIAKHDAKTAATGADAPTKKIDKEKADWKSNLPKPPLLTFDPAKTYVWILETDKGYLRAKLLPDVAPYHCSNAIYLARLGFYDGLNFHRVIQRFMAQGGDPTGTGGGGPGYQFSGEFKPSVNHDKPFLLSMAHAGPGTDGSQFFVTFVPTAHLDQKHTIFGELIDEESRTTAKEIEKIGALGNGPPKEKVGIKRSLIEVR